MNLLPEECIHHILSLTTPRDACRSSLVSLSFRSATDSDLLWEKFLPSDYEEIISRSVSPVAFSSKKELYLRLCDHPILIDDGIKSFALDKWSGKKCYMIAAREISWGDDPDMWVWRPFADSRFAEVAESRVPLWLNICGRMETGMLSPRTTYVAYLVFKVTEHAYELDCYPAQVFVRLGEGGGELVECSYFDPANRVSLQYYRPPPTPEGQYREHWVHLQPPLYGMLEVLFDRPPLETQYTVTIDPLPHMRGDGWKEVELGEFFNNQGEVGEVEMYLVEQNSRHGMAGLIIQGIELRPKQERKFGWPRHPRNPAQS